MDPYFSEQHLNAENYFIFLQNDLFNFLRHINNDLLNQMWFQHGAPAHRSRNVTKFLNNRFRNRWIGMDSRTHEWPPKSSDLNPLDFYFWGYIK